MKNKKLIFIQTLVALMLISAIYTPGYAAIYRWVDKEGITHFSDTPPADRSVTTTELKDLDLTPSSTTPAPTTSQTSAPGSPTDAATPSSDNKSTTYESITILTPTNKENILDADGKIGISLKVAPNLGENDAIQVLLDGNPLGEPNKALGYNLSNIDRGEHQLVAQIVDASKNVLLKSEPTTFYVQRPSKLFSSNNQNSQSNQNAQNNQSK